MTGSDRMFLTILGATVGLYALGMKYEHERRMACIARGIRPLPRHPVRPAPKTKTGEP